MALLKRTKVGRDINRHYFNQAEIHNALQRPVVKRLIELIRLRNTHPAFDGVFSCATPDESTLEMRWTNAAQHAALIANVATGQWEIRVSTDIGVVSALSSVNLRDEIARIESPADVAAAHA
jgi:sucrose phosphorylase